MGEGVVVRWELGAVVRWLNGRGLNGGELGALTVEKVEGGEGEVWSVPVTGGPRAGEVLKFKVGAGEVEVLGEGVRFTRPRVKA